MPFSKNEHSNSLKAWKIKKNGRFLYLPFVLVIPTRLAIRYAHVRRPFLRSVSNSTRSTLLDFTTKNPPYGGLFSGDA